MVRVAIVLNLATLDRTDFSNPREWAAAQAPLRHFAHCAITFVPLRAAAWPRPDPAPPMGAPTARIPQLARPRPLGFVASPAFRTGRFAGAGRARGTPASSI